MIPTRLREVDLTPGEAVVITLPDGERVKVRYKGLRVKGGRRKPSAGGVFLIDRPPGVEVRRVAVARDDLAGRGPDRAA